MIRQTKYLCGPNERQIIKEAFDQVALKGRVTEEDINEFTAEIDNWFDVIATEVTNVCLTQRI